MINRRTEGCVDQNPAPCAPTKWRLQMNTIKKKDSSKQKKGKVAKAKKTKKQEAQKPVVYKPDEIRKIEFYGDTIETMRIGETLFVGIRSVCDRLDLSWKPQFVKLSNHPTFSQGVTMVVTPSPGGAQASLCLSLDLFFGWLMNINPRRVKPEAKERLVCYQRESFRAIMDYWTEGVAINPRMAEHVLRRTESRSAFAQANISLANYWINRGESARADHYAVRAGQVLENRIEPPEHLYLSDFLREVGEVEESRLRSAYLRLGFLLSREEPELAMGRKVDGDAFGHVGSSRAYGPDQLEQIQEVYEKAKRKDSLFQACLKPSVRALYTQPTLFEV